LDSYEESGRNGLEVKTRNNAKNQFAKAAALSSNLVGPDVFPLLKKHGLIPTMVPGGSSIKNGINDKKNHAEIERKMR
jgi:hypothetical protein